MVVRTSASSDAHVHVEPLAVAPQLEPRRVVVEDLERLLLVGAGVRLDLLDGQHRPQLGAPARVPDARGEVADDQHDHVAGVLEVAQLAQHDRVPEVDVGRRRVDPQLHAQRAPEGQLALERARRQDLRGPARQLLEGLRGHRRQC